MHLDLRWCYHSHDHDPLFRVVQVYLADADWPVEVYITACTQDFDAVEIFLEHALWCRSLDHPPPDTGRIRAGFSPIMPEREKWHNEKAVVSYSPTSDDFF